MMRVAAGLLLGMLAPALLVLGACSPARMDDLLVTCPDRALPADVSELSRYLPGAAPDLSTLVLEARVTGMEYRCSRGSGDRSVEARVALVMEVDRGPAATGRQAQIPWFVAVLEGDRVLSRQSFLLPVTFAPNTSRARLSTQTIEISFPVREGRRMQDLRILGGFQLTEEELALNRRRAPRAL